jgi:hypothetical protein
MTAKKPTAAQPAKSKADEAKAAADKTAVTQPPAAVVVDDNATAADIAAAQEKAEAEAAAETTNSSQEVTNKPVDKKSFQQVAPDFIEVKTVKGVSSFRRAGLAFTQQPTRIPLDDLSEDQIEALNSEPRLVVTLIAEGAE